MSTSSHQTTALHITYTITSPDGSVLIAGDFPSDLLSRKFKHRYNIYLSELKAVLLNSGWFEELKTKVENKLNRDYFYDKINDSRLKLVDMSDTDNIDIVFLRYIDRQPLFRIRQEHDDDDELFFTIRLENNRESFEYSCMIATREDFKRTIENTIESLEPYKEFISYKNDLSEILDQL